MPPPPVPSGCSEVRPQTSVPGGRVGFEPPAVQWYTPYNANHSQYQSERANQARKVYAPKETVPVQVALLHEKGGAKPTAISVRPSVNIDHIRLADCNLHRRFHILI